MREDDAGIAVSQVAGRRMMNLRLSSVLRIHEETEWYINTNDAPHFSTYISEPFLP